jgi:hypothetical protein
LSETKEKFEQWALVELMGHQSVVGRCSEQVVGGGNMLRVDIPKGDGFFTRYFGPSAIYAITVLEESVARKLSAGRRDANPPFSWELQRAEPKILPSAPAEGENEEEDEDVEF